MKFYFDIISVPSLHFAQKTGSGNEEWFYDNVEVFLKELSIFKLSENSWKMVFFFY